MTTTALAQPSTGTNRGLQSGYLPKSTDTPISFEDVGAYPGRACLGRTGAPTRIRFSPDDDDVVFLGVDDAGGGLTQKLYRRNVSDASSLKTELASPPAGVGEEDTLSEEEKLRRERTRQLETGITSFEYAADDDTLLCPVGNDLFVQQGGNTEKKELTRLVDSALLPGAVLDPHVSNNGALVVFVCDKELYGVATTEGADVAPQRLTFDARGTARTNGLADFIAMEEMERFGGFWISNDAEFVAFEQSDESHIPEFKIMHSGQSDPKRQEDHRYPFAGEENPKVRLGLVEVASKKVRWLDISSVFGEDMYLSRVQWGAKSATTQHLYVQVMNREQSELVLLRFDVPATNNNDDEKEEAPTLVGRELLRESRPSQWINLHDMLVPLEKGGFLWASERTGHSHLYRYDDEGDLISTLTSGEWAVETTSSATVDEKEGLVYFTGTKDSPKEAHLYCVSLDGDGNGGEDNVRRVTSAGGTHTVLSFDHKKECFIDSWSSLQKPFRVAVKSLKDGSVIRDLYDGSDDDKVRSMRNNGALSPPEFFDVKADDGTVLHGALYRPSGTGPWPTIVSTYGGPHAQTVADSWGLTADLRAQRLRSQGYAVVKLDNRGSARRGLAFETAIRHDMGNVEVEDQVRAVQHWIDQGVVQRDRVGVYGWSYGGYMSAMCLAKRPDVFKAAVAGAMVSSWDGYDTCYTERYMGTPQSNPEGYARSAVMPYVDNIEGSLLIVHGLIDENVHFRHSARLISALIKARKHYELLLFPDERHVPRGLADKIFMEERIASFFERVL